MVVSLYIPTNSASGEGNGDPLRYSCLENSMERGASQAAVHRVKKSRTRLSDFHITTVQEGSLFSTPSPAFIVCRYFDDGYSGQCEVIYHCSFDLHFSNNERHWASFHVFVSHLYVFFGEMSVWVFFPLFGWIVCFSDWVVWAACMFWKLILCQLFHLLLFSSILRVFSPCL